MNQHEFVAKWRRRPQGTRRLPGALPRPLPPGRPPHAGRGRPHRRVLHLRGRRGQDRRRPGLGRRLEEGLLRLGVQGQARRPGRRLPAAAPVPRGAGEPAAAGRLRHRPHRRPHQLHQHRQAHRHDHAGRPADARGHAPPAQRLLRPGSLPRAADRRAGHRGGGRASSPAWPTTCAAWGPTRGRVAHFLIRLLFCLFAEDIDLLPRQALHPAGRQRAAAGRTPSAASCASSSQAMAAGGCFGVHRIRHFDGGLFDDDDVLALDRRRRSTSCTASPAWTGPASSRPSSARSLSAAWTRPSGRSWARTTPAARTSCSSSSRC